MMAQIKAGLVSLRELVATAWWIILVASIGFVVAYQFVEPAPPKTIVISTGGESGAYYHFAQRYATILARNGVTLEIKASAVHRFVERAVAAHDDQAVEVPRRERADVARRVPRSRRAPHGDLGAARHEHAFERGDALRRAASAGHRVDEDVDAHGDGVGGSAGGSRQRFRAP